MHQKIGPLNHRKTGPLNEFLDAVFGAQKLVPLSPPNKELQIARPPPRNHFLGAKNCIPKLSFWLAIWGLFLPPRMGRRGLFVPGGDRWVRFTLCAMSHGRLLVACRDERFRPILIAMGRGGFCGM